jgi:hypothetical protein
LALYANSVVLFVPFLETGMIGDFGFPIKGNKHRVHHDTKPYCLPFAES